MNFQETEYTFLNATFITEQDRSQLSQMMEAYFRTAQDPDQIQIGRQTGNWIKTAIPECAMLIKKGDEVIGATLVLPATWKMMEKFVSCQINEAKLAEEIKAWFVNYNDMEAIYFCSAFIASVHRGKNLAITALLKSIKNISPRNKNIPLFYWAYSSNGYKLAAKLATILKTELYAKETAVQ